MIRLRERDEVFFLGKGYNISLVQTLATRSFTLISEKTISVYRSSPSQNYREILFSDLKNRSAKFLRDKVEYFSTKNGFTPNRVSIKDTSSRWGSCSSLGNINLNWRLCFAPLEVIDYVIVHELCHLRQMNHGKAFWDEVRTILPDFKKHERWLKENGKGLRVG